MIRNIKLFFNNELNEIQALKILQAISKIELDCEVELEYNWIDKLGYREEYVSSGFIDDEIKKLESSSYVYWMKDYQ